MRDSIGDGSLRKAVATVMWWTLGFAALHSLFVSRHIEDWVCHRYGDSTFDGIYRLGFNALALTTFSTLLLRFSALPDRELYVIRRPLSLLMRLVQALAIWLVLDANGRIGFGRMSGVHGFWEWLRGECPAEQNPAQGPQLDADVTFRTGGSFRLSRHPNNLAPLILWIAHPRMTVRFLAFILVSAVYLVIGSVHEERRLRRVYGGEYERYRARVPFYLPLPR